MYLSNFNLEQIQKGQSKWTEQQLGKKIATDQLSLQCRPHIPEAPGSRLMDSEGVICRDLDLIENGTLIHFINNLESAAKAGLSPTGHGSRGIRSKAGASFSNLFVPKGTSSLSDLLHSHSRCLYITKLEGGAACSAISGELSIGVQGFWVEDGAIVHPVDSITLNGNFFDLLNQIEGISNAYQDSFSSYHIPDLLVTGLSTSG
jgi:PmbA protein